MYVVGSSRRCIQRPRTPNCFSTTSKSASTWDFSVATWRARPCSTRNSSNRHHGERFTRRAVHHHAAVELLTGLLPCPPVIAHVSGGASLRRGTARARRSPGPDSSRWKFTAPSVSKLTICGTNWSCVAALINGLPARISSSVQPPALVSARKGAPHAQEAAFIHARGHDAAVPRDPDDSRALVPDAVLRPGVAFVGDAHFARRTNMESRWPPTAPGRARAEAESHRSTE